jgi:hypothetical protein
MRKIRIAVILVTIAALLPFLGPVDAAQIDAGYSADGSCSVTLSGEITPGDRGSLASLLKGLPNEGFGAVLCLDSPGGSFTEGLEIAKLLLQSAVSTEIDSNANCYSACAIVFMAGTQSQEGFLSPLRHLHILGKLGFHAPYIVAKEGSYGSETLSEAYREGVISIARLMKLEPGKPHAEFFPKELIVELAQRGPAESFDIDTIGKVIDYNIDLDGLDGPHRFSDYTAEQICPACDNYEHEIGQVGDCQLSTLQKKVDKKKSQVQYSFLNFGAEEGGITCVLTAGFLGQQLGTHNDQMY